MNPSANTQAVQSTPGKKRVVILGGGFAGFQAAKSLGNRKQFDVTLVDRVNHWVFQPLLYQVATASLSAQEIAAPLRSLLAKYANVRVLLAEAERVDVNARCVYTSTGVLPYDYLLVACGVQTSYFGNERWEAFAPGLKNLSQATEICSRIFTEFEIAERSTAPAELKKRLTFVVVGGGATGVEMAGAIAEICRLTLTDDFRSIVPAHARVILVEATGRLLSSFSEKMSERARRDLEAMGVEVRLNTSVRDIREDIVVLDSERIEDGATMWAAGVRGVPIATTLGAQLDKRGCVHVGPDCSIAGHPEVFVVGDLAVCLHHKTGKPLGQVANVAGQQGRHFGRTLRRDLKGKPRKPFHYFNKGQMATIGVGRAICEIGPIGFGGWFAWLVWIVIHIYYLSNMRDRFFVLLHWTWSLLTKARHARVLIPSPWRTYPDPARASESDDAVRVRAGDTAA